MLLNVPNTLTLLRLLLIPIYTYIALDEGFSPQWVAAIAFGLAAVTDWFDGYFARRLNQVTEFGKIADPIVDRLLIASVFIILYIKLSEIVPLWTVLIVVGRDLIMVLGWLYMNRLGVKIRVSAEGKVTAGVLMFSAFFLLLDFNPLKLIGIFLFYLGVILSLISGFKYISLGITTLKSTAREETII